MSKTVENIKIENARLVFRNFAGKPDKFNPQGGKRGFSVVLSDHKFANDLKEEGWNIKQFNPRDEDDTEPDYYLPIKVSFDVRPPHIYLCTKRAKVLLEETTINQLDYAEISGVDIIISPYSYEVGGRTGISAYVKTMYVNVVEDEFASKYAFDDEEPLPFD